ncbi:MAG TPA: RpiB/LacA/LacB family sugar-phosphate isomerase, partial [Candidatus Binatia bacterium]|nr:RpiB/LacA/LacB family sugar-phosphate isomerase [Candidatus Binatia bacterium]
MRIIIGADHAGYPLKTTLADDLRARGHEVTDVGTAGEDP